MSKKTIKENNFEGGMGGMVGASSTQPGSWGGTAASPEVSQNSNQFASSNNNKAVNQMGNTAKEAPGSGSMEGDVNAIYAKKDTPSVDEVVTGLKYELGQQIKKDKRLAKETVLQNLKKNPHFYTELKMLNIDDQSMVDNMNESKHPNDAPARTKVTPNIEETKKIFAEMAKGREKKYVVNSQIVDVMEEMWKAKRERNAWRS
jgi:hypothetical protein